MDTEYENRVVFYFDILGFRDLLATSLIRNGNNCSSILELFKYINNFYQVEIDDKYSLSKKITFFSDSVIISFVEDEPDQVFKTISDIQILLITLVLKGIVMRGAISYGKLYHNEKFLFGPAFVDAYLTETTKAKHPRIICDSSILILSQQGKSIQAAEQDLKVFLEILKEDQDNLFYIDYFQDIESLFENNYEHVDYLLQLRTLITENIKNAKSKRIRRKYIWMRHKYNKAIKKIINVRNLAGIDDIALLTNLKQLTLIGAD